MLKITKIDADMARNPISHLYFKLYIYIYIRNMHLLYITAFKGNHLK